MDPFPILRMSPHLAERPWGGRRLGTLLGKGNCGEVCWGESWEVSDHPEGPSAIASGPFQGQPFREVLHAFPSELTGRKQAPERFPILIKYIDAAEDLSIQVHPSDEYTIRKGLPDRGKTECWYIMDCPADAEVIYGLKPGAAADDLLHSIQQGRPEEVVRRIPIQPGMFLSVPAGTVHAILGGTLLCEIQQTSNLTFRIWDWGRKPERELHLDQALETIVYASPPDPILIAPDPGNSCRRTPLVSNSYFTVTALQPGTDSSLDVPTSGEILILNGVSGSGSVDGELLPLGGTLLVPAVRGCVSLVAQEAPWVVLATQPTRNSP